VVLDRFSVESTCAAIAQHRVTVLCCVSTQLTMLIADRASREYDLSSLRVVFTGGEALPYRPAAEFETLTGAKILQFYGSNEIDPDGYLSVTGRTSDFILRGGKNISAAQVEDTATMHPAIAVAAAVAMPDPVFGERVCLYAELVHSQTIDLPSLVEYLLAAGV